MPRGRVAEDLKGKRFGKLLVLERAGRHGHHACWKVRCDCGTVKLVAASWLKSHTKSCGCLKKERERAQRKHGNATSGEKRATITYQSWQAMKSRCEYPKNISFEYYGGRGIQVCKRWRDNYVAFLEDMGERPKGKTLDRVNPNGDYEPANCRWATPVEQARTRRKPKERTT